MALTNLTSVAWPPPVTSEVLTSPDPGQWGSGTPPASAQSCFWNVDISSRVPPCFYLASAPSPPTFGFLASLWLLWSKYFPLLPVPTRPSSYRFLLNQLLIRAISSKPTKCYEYLGVIFLYCSCQTFKSNQYTLGVTFCTVNCRALAFMAIIDW